MREVLIFRYAFIRFKNVHDAIEAYKENVDIIIDNRSVVLRFRRINNKVKNFIVLFEMKPFRR